MQTPSDDLRDFWFRPWIGAHVSWSQPGTAPQGWRDVHQRGPAACWQARDLWVRHFELRPVSLAVIAHPSDVPLTASAAMFEAAATRIGMAVLCTREDFGALWMKRQQELQQAAPLAAWQSALRDARLRPLADAHAGMADLHTRLPVAAGVVVSGAAWMRRLCAEAPLWCRLRQRLHHSIGKWLESLEWMDPSPARSSSERLAASLWRAGLSAPIGKPDDN